MINEMKAKGRIVIAGGSGFLGRNLARSLSDAGCEVVVLSRNPSTNQGGGRQVSWDGRTPGSWAREGNSMGQPRW